MTVTRKSTEWFLYLKFIPLTVFLLYARYQGMTTLAWKEAFILAGILALCITSILIYKRVLLDRLMLGMNLFFLVGASAFLFAIMPLLYFYGTYKGAAFFCNILFVGFVTTFFAQAGFVGVQTSDASQVRYCSLLLLGGCILGLIWSTLTNAYGLFISAGLPFICLKSLQEFLAKRFTLK